MAEKRKRAQNYTLEEKEKLLQLVMLVKNTILNKRTDHASNMAKYVAWTNVCKKFNSGNTTNRSKDSLMKLFEKMRSEAKLYMSSRDNNSDGQYSEKCDPIIEQVCQLMNEGSDDHDDDSEMESLMSSDPNGEAETNFFEESFEGEHSQFHVEPEVILEENFSPTLNNAKTPPARKRRRAVTEKDLTSTYKDILMTMNKKKIERKILKKKLLQEEIAFKRKLYEYQLEAARKDLEIKNEILNQIRGGGLNLQGLFGLPNSTNNNND